MRGIAILVIVLIVIGFFVRTKLVERDELQVVASEFFYEFCSANVGCTERLDLFRPCFSQGYALSPLPGGDVVDIRRVVTCLNGNHPVMKAERVLAADPPFPHR
ncbi:MAG: hypothetical protein GY906_27245 [bacterium]|nr:hypothetical protein [bacterium]